MSRRYMDPAIIGSARLGYFRVGVRNPMFERMFTRSIGKTVEVTRKARQASIVYDVETGWPVISFIESTIDCRLDFGPSRIDDLPPGIVGTLDGVIYTVDPLVYQDRFIYPKITGDIYQVVSPCQERRGLEGGFLYRRGAFRKLELTV